MLHISIEHIYKLRACVFLSGAHHATLVQFLYLRTQSYAVPMQPSRPTTPFLEVDIMWVHIKHESVTLCLACTSYTETNCTVRLGTSHRALPLPHHTHIISTSKNHSSSLPKTVNFLTTLLGFLTAQTVKCTGYSTKDLTIVVLLPADAKIFILIIAPRAGMAPLCLLFHAYR